MKRHFPNSLVNNGLSSDHKVLNRGLESTLARLERLVRSKVGGGRRSSVKVGSSPHNDDAGVVDELELGGADHRFQGRVVLLGFW